MSSSSGPDPGPRLDVAEIEQAEELVEQRLPREAALGEGKAVARRGRRLVTAMWALLDEFLGLLDLGDVEPGTGIRTRGAGHPPPSSEP